MKKSIVGLVLCICLIAVGAFAFNAIKTPPTLWGKTQYGMTQTEVLKVLPNAKPIKNGSTFSDGSIERLRIEDVSIVGRVFVASFLFEGEKLNSVSFKPAVSPHSTDGRALLDSLIVSLRAKYGPETYKEERDDHSRKSWDFRWKSKGTDITMYVLQIGENFPIFRLGYQVNSPEDEDVL